MKKEFLTLAHHYDVGCFSRQIEWMASRKLNGWACFWDGGITRGMVAAKVPWYYMGKDKPITSTGLWTLGRGNKPKVVNVPDWWLDDLPRNVPVQGELWKNDDLEYVKSVCGRGISGRTDDRWRDITFMGYNVKPYSLLPVVTSIDMRSSPFYANCGWRQRNVKAQAHGGSVVWVTQHLVKSSTEFEKYFEDTVRKGWEGAMLVNPDGWYEDHRSYNLLKRKPVFEAEATVIGYEDGKTGKTIGKMGAVVARIIWDEKVSSVPGGREGMVGSLATFGISGWCGDERDWDYIKRLYPIGSEISFKYNGVTKEGIPVSANVLRGNQ